MPMILWTPPREALASSKISLWPLNPGSRKFSSIYVDKESLRRTPLLGISSTWLSLSHAGHAKAVYCNRGNIMSFRGQHRQLTRWTCYRSREGGSKQGLLVLCAAVRKYLTLGNFLWTCMCVMCVYMIYVCVVYVHTRLYVCVL